MIYFAYESNFFNEVCTGPFGGYTKVHEIAFKAKNVEVLTFDRFESQFRADFT